MKTATVGHHKTRIIFHTHLQRNNETRLKTFDHGSANPVMGRNS